RNNNLKVQNHLYKWLEKIALSKVNIIHAYP
ncbi:hypothetical protein ACUXDN_002035, partial [Staphylococcus hominis]